MNFRIRACFVAVFSGLLAVSCGGGGGGQGTDPINPVVKVKAGADQLKLRPFQSCSAYREFLSDSFTNSLLIPYVYDWPLPVQPTGLVPAPASPGLSQNPNFVSATNLIEAGVDEADLVKTDAEGNMFVASGRFLVIADGFPPASMNTVTEFELVEQGTAQSLFIDEESARAMVVVRNTPDPLAADTTPIYNLYGTTLIFIDIADIANPNVTGRLWLVNTLEERLIDGRVHLWSQENIPIPMSFTPTRIYRHC